MINIKLIHNNLKDIFYNLPTESKFDYILVSTLIKFEKHFPRHEKLFGNTIYTTYITTYLNEQRQK